MRRDVAPTREPGGGMPKVARGQAHVKNRICGAVARGAGCGSRTRARHVREAQGTRPRGCARARLHKRLTVPSSATSAATAVIVLMICCEWRSWQSDLEWKCVLGTAASEALQRRCRCDCCQKVTSSSGAVLRKKCALPRGARRVAGRLWLQATGPLVCAPQQTPKLARSRTLHSGAPHRAVSPCATVPQLPITTQGQHFPCAA